MHYEPKFGRVLIEREIKEKTAGGIILTDPKRVASCKGKIVALGENAGFTSSYYKNEDGTWEPRTVQNMCVGDEVIFGRYSGTWLDATLNGKGEANDDGKLFICQDEDILAVIKE